MWKSKALKFAELRNYIDTIPVIETHQHYVGICPKDEELDILAVLCLGYHRSDLWSCADDFANDVCAYISDKEVAFDKRFKTWDKYWKRTRNTAYAKAFFEGFKACWGIDDLKKSTLIKLQERMRRERDSDFYQKMYEKFNIKAMIVNVELVDILEKKVDFSPICRFVFDLPGYHSLFNINDIRKAHLKNEQKRAIISLDDYLEAFELYLKKAIEFGIVGIKDQTAYRRCINYRNVAKSDAENIFNKIMERPRDAFGTEEIQPLDDFLFHEFMKMAAKYKLPVQIHTGHMAGIRNDIMKTNPAHLTSVLELHQDVSFDLFHGGWPFMGEYLFLGKNYPNVNLDMCWCNSIDPLYSVEFFKRAIMTVPQSKISGFGGDCGSIEVHIGYLIQACDNIAIALSELIDSGWLDLEEAKQVAVALLHDNPARIFGIK
ncbi:MAG: amidohydrolase [Victivallales bacterium]|nr:amidohydrolase [Victivallales bacterium]